MKIIKIEFVDFKLGPEGLPEWLYYIIKSVNKSDNEYVIIDFVLKNRNKEYWIKLGDYLLKKINNLNLWNWIYIEGDFEPLKIDKYINTLNKFEDSFFYSFDYKCSILPSLFIKNKIIRNIECFLLLNDNLSNYVKDFVSMIIESDLIGSDMFIAKIKMEIEKNNYNNFLYPNDKDVMLQNSIAWIYPIDGYAGYIVGVRKSEEGIIDTNNISKLENEVENYII